MKKKNNQAKLDFFSYFKEEKKAFSAQPKSVRAVFVFLLLSAFLFGLYYEWTAYLAGIVLIILNLYVIRRNRKIQFSKSPGAIAMALMVLCYFLTVFYGVDKGMSFAGAVKMIVPLLFLILILQFDRDEVCYLWHAVPDSAILTLLISLILWMIPQTRDFVSSAGRLGGIFQYSNTFALYLLIGIVVLMCQKKFNFSHGLCSSFLTIGILLTGSRFMLVLTFLWFLYQFIAVPKYRKWIGISAIILLIAGGAYVFITGDRSNIGRILTINTLTGTSSLNGRLLYWKDALGMMIQKPFGMGYLGYYYLQTAFQTGDYVVRYVHHDWLQFILDIGIHGFALVLIMVIDGLKKADASQRKIFIVLATAGFFDFHLTYLSVFFLLLMTFHFEKRVSFDMMFKVMKAGYCLSALLLLLFFWLGLSFDFDYFGDYASACKVFPGNTESRIYLLQSTGDLEEGKEHAESIIRQNGHVSLAFYCRALYEKETGDYYGMMRDIERMLDHNRYNIEAYENVLELLSDSIQEANKKGDKDLFVALIEQALSIPERISAVLEETDGLAWKIDEKPELTLPNNYINYLKTLEETLKKVR